MPFSEIAASEVMDWWDETRSDVANKCAECEQELNAFVDAKTRDFSTVDLVNPFAQVRETLQGHIDERIGAFEKALSDELKTSLTNSLKDIEETALHSNIDWSGTGVLAASGATALGAVGLATGAVGLSTVSLPAFVFFATTPFSWPLFAALGAGVMALGVASVTARYKAKQMLLSKYRRHLHGIIRQRLTAINDGQSPSIKMQAFQSLDLLRDQRLEIINNGDTVHHSQ